MTPDEELLGLLGQALRPPELEPPPASLGALAHAVAHTFQPSTRASRWRLRLLVASALFAVGASGSATAVAVGAVDLPAPVRSLAHGIGLPVDSVDLARAKADAARLSLDLRSGDEARIARDASELQARYDALDGHERKGLGAEVDGLLQRAVHIGDEGGPSGPTPPVEAAEPAGGGGNDAGGLTGSSHDGSPSTTVEGVDHEGGSPAQGSDSSPSGSTSGGQTVQPEGGPTPQSGETSGGGDGGASPSPTSGPSAPTSTTPTTTAPAGDGGTDGGSDGGISGSGGSGSGG